MLSSDRIRTIINYIVFSPFHNRTRALVQWLKMPAWKVGDRKFEAHTGLQVSKKQNVSSPITRDVSILWGASVTER